MEEYRIDPTIAYDVVELPSRGIHYQNKKKSLRVAYLTAVDENILSAQNLIATNGVVDELLKRKVLDREITPEELTERAHTLDRYLMNMYYFIPMFYDNTSRVAYWVNNITFPEINAKIGTNIMAYGWKPEVAAAPTTSCTTDGIFCRIKSFVKSLF